MLKQKELRQKHIPIRTCIATGEKRPKKEFLRIVLNPKSGEFEIDLRNKIRARGANLLPTIEAFDLMIKKNALARALKLERKVSDEEYKILRHNFVQAIEEKKFRPSNKPVTIRLKKREIEKLKNKH